MLNGSSVLIAHICDRVNYYLIKSVKKINTPTIANHHPLSVDTIHLIDMILCVDMIMRILILIDVHTLCSTHLQRCELLIRFVYFNTQHSFVICFQFKLILQFVFMVWPNWSIAPLFRLNSKFDFVFFQKIKNQNWSKFIGWSSYERFSFGLWPLSRWVWCQFQLRWSNQCRAIDIYWIILVPLIQFLWFLVQRPPWRHTENFQFNMTTTFIVAWLFEPYLK